MSRILNNIRVLDLSRVVAAPYATQCLGDMGAEVIKVERPGIGDDSRQYGPPFSPDGKGGHLPETPLFMGSNRNKLGIAVDLASAEGQAIIRDLARVSDVVVENFKTGDLARYGLDYASLRQINPRLIYCSVTGFGQTGPYATKPGVDSVFQGMSGMMQLTGEPDGDPQRVGFPVGDVMTALYTLSAILGALYHRDANGGEGQHIDIACLEGAIAAQSSTIMQYFMTGKQPQRRGNATHNAIPSQPFQCADVPIMVSAATDYLFAKFCRGIGQPDLATDPRFARSRDRSANSGILIPLISAIMIERPASEWMARFDAEGVICGPIYGADEVFSDPQVLARGMRIDLPNPGFGTLSFLRNPIRYSATDLDSYTRPPQIGEHTDAVLGRLLDLDAAALSALRTAGVVA